MRNGPSAKKKKLTIRQMKKISYNFEKKKVSMLVKKIVQSWYFFKMRVYYFFLPVSSRKKEAFSKITKKY